MTCLSKSLILTPNESVLSTGRFTLLLVWAFPEILLNADSFFIITSYALKNVFSPSTVLYLFFYENPAPENLFSHAYSRNNSLRILAQLSAMRAYIKAFSLAANFDFALPS